MIHNKYFAAASSTKSITKYHQVLSLYSQSRVNDLFGPTIIYDTLCDNNNNTIPTEDEDRIIMNKDITRSGEKLQMIHLKDDKVGFTAPEFNNDEREFDRDFDRHAMLNVVMSEEYNQLNQIPIRNCASWNSKKEHANPNLVIAMVTHALSSLNVSSVRAIVALVSEMKSQYDSATIWEVSINQGQTYVNELTSAVLNRPEITQ